MYWIRHNTVFLDSETKRETGIKRAFELDATSIFSQLEACTEAITTELNSPLLTVDRLSLQWIEEAERTELTRTIRRHKLLLEAADYMLDRSLNTIARTTVSKV